jgi:predicted secreted protein
MDSRVRLLIVCGVAIAGCRAGASSLAHAGAAAPSASGGGADAGADASAGADAGAVIGVQDDGKTFDVAVGSIITFALASNAGTGYVWVPTHVDDNVVATVGARASERDSDTPGASKRDIYRFRARAAGTAWIEMSLERPFGHSRSGRIVRVTFHVR